MRALHSTFLAIAFVTLLITPSFAQYNVIGIDLPHGITGKFKPSFERSIGKKFSVLLNYESGVFATGSSGSINSQSEVYRLTGKGWMSGARYYPFVKRKASPKGFSLGLYYRRMNFRESYTGEVRSNNPPFNSQSVNIRSKGESSNFGFSMAYKFSAGHFIFEPLVGFGSINYTWDNAMERELIDPFFRANLDDFLYSGRIELKIGFYFPKMPTYEKRIENIPGRRTEPTELKDDNDTGSNKIQLYVYRPWKLSGMAISYDVVIDDSLSAAMYNGNFELIELTETKDYKISAKTEEEKIIVVPLEKGKTYYLRCKIGVGLLIGRPVLKFVGPYEGEMDINDLQLRREKKKKR